MDFQNFQVNIPGTLCNEPFTINMLKFLSNFEATSVDGKPLLNPFQFAHMSPRQSYPAPTKDTKTNINGKKLFTESFQEDIVAIPQIDKLELIKKKVKITEGEERVLSETSTICTSPNLVVQSKSAEPVLGKEILNKKYEIETRITKRSEKGKTSSRSCFEKVKNHILFHAMDQNQKLVSLSRKEILEKNPLLLIYYYEKHLKFVKSSDFNPEKLKKLKFDY